jgi:hypothetical protein
LILFETGDWFGEEEFLLKIKRKYNVTCVSKKGGVLLEIG